MCSIDFGPEAWDTELRILSELEGLVVEVVAKTDNEHHDAVARMPLGMRFDALLIGIDYEEDGTDGTVLRLRRWDDEKGEPCGEVFSTPVYELTVY